MSDVADHASPATAPIANAPSGPQPDGLNGRRPPATLDRTLYMVGATHLDPVWLWPWQEGYQEARATFRSALDRMEEYPDFVFTCDQVVLLAWVEEQDPELFERIQARVAEGRWVNAGGWWVEPDCNMPTGESFARQGLLGQRYLAEKFGKTATVGMNVDPFGHNAMIPAILRGQGMDSYTFLRPGPAEDGRLGTAFWWEAPDGSRVLGYRIPHEYCSPPGDVSGHTDKALAALDRSLGDLMVLFGVGNHGGGPTKANIDSIHRFDRMGSFGRLVMSSPRQYFDEFIARRGGIDSEEMAQLPVWTDDLQHHSPGCYSAHSGIKAWQRRAQNAVLSAERWAAVGTRLHGLEHPGEDLHRAWQQVLFNQFHDILPGSAIEPSYDDSRDQLGEAIAISKRIITKVQNVIARKVDVPFADGTQPVLVFNPHPWPVRQVVELQYGAQPLGVHVVDAADRPVACQKVQSVATTDDKGRAACAFETEIPAFGYRLYRLLRGPKEIDDAGLTVAEHAGATVVENQHLRLEIDQAGGWVRSLLDKRTGADVFGGATGPHTQVCDDPTDTWGHRVVSYAWPGEEMPVVRALVRESGPVRARIRVERAWGRSTLVEEFILTRDSDHVEVRTTLDWREEHHLLKLRFPVALDETEATYEIPYAAIDRPVDGAEEPAQQWVSVSGTLRRGDHRRAGLAVVTTTKHGYDVSPAENGADPSIGVTAVRSPVYSWHDPRLLDPEGFYSFQDQGMQSFSYLLVPHAGDWREANLTRRGNELSAPVRAMLESFHDGELAPVGSFAADGGEQVMITAIKITEAARGGGAPDLIVRAVETTGRPARARLELPLTGQVLETDFGAHQIRTFRITADGAVTETDLIEWPLADGPVAEISTQPLGE
ncbi:alpha-mannosidase [Ruania alba]|uniref:Alpha-mannosidase n=1 Tax=Ruania alba TaxID=648782 RepID=A0A1H5GAM1_9MICO|nr:alpha-mannosidase [Ruania alba]SEE12725.1 alpha-mannosidase [Ruania alba]